MPPSAVKNAQPPRVSRRAPLLAPRAEASEMPPECTDSAHKECTNHAEVHPFRCTNALSGPLIRGKHSCQQSSFNFQELATCKDDRSGNRFRHYSPWEDETPVEPGFRLWPHGQQRLHRSVALLEPLPAPPDLGLNACEIAQGDGIPSCATMTVHSVARHPHFDRSDGAY